MLIPFDPHQDHLPTRPILPEDTEPPMPVTDEEWERIVEEAKDTETHNAKWRSRQDAFGCLGSLVGAIGGPCLFFLSLATEEWMNSIKEGYGFFWGMILLLISISLGAIVGFKIAKKITDRLQR